MVEQARGSPHSRPERQPGWELSSEVRVEFGGPEGEP
jgi:hypothetical protein